MKHVIFALFFISIFKINAVSAQTKTTIKNSFVIHGENVTPTDLAFYTKSIEDSDFEQFRLQTETVILRFKNGFTLELISAKDIVIRNIKQDLDVNTYTNYASTPDYKYPLFEVLSSGWITAAVENNSKKAN
jgi:hypothetical protein